MENNKETETSMLDRDFTLKSLLKFALPSMFGIFITALYQMTDGYFINLFVGEIAISAVNLFYPALSILIASGLMIGTGANAVIVREIGRGNKEKANNVFSQTLIVAAAFGFICLLVYVFFADPIMEMLGATEVTWEYLKAYYMSLVIISPIIVLQSTFGILIMGEGKMMQAATLAIGGGIINVILDFVFMKFFHMGIKGAAIATALSYIIPVLYIIGYYVKGKSIYTFKPVRIKFADMWEVLFNGSSEMITNLATGVTTFIMNHLAMKFFGEIGVSALTVITYLQFVMMAAFMGFTTAVEPVFSFHYGNGNVQMRKKVFKLSFQSILYMTIGIILFFLLFHKPFISVFFFKEGTEAFNITREGLLLMLTSCVFFGTNVFVSGMFTALSNGKISALLSVLRTLVFLIIALYGMSALFGEIGFWLATTVAELFSFIVSIVMLIKYRKVYEYM